MGSRILSERTETNDWRLGIAALNAAKEQRPMKRTDTKFHRFIDAKHISNAEKYKMLVIGRPGWGVLLKHELIMLLCSWVPGVLGLFMRNKLYPAILGSVGRGVVFGSNIVFRHPHKIHIGDGVIIDDNVLVDAKGSENEGVFIGSKAFIGRNSILSCKDGDIRLMEGVNLGFNCEVFSSSSVVIGKHSIVAAYSYIIGGGNYDISHSAPDFSEQDGLMTKGGIKIENNCWLAADVKVLDGVNIGRGSVIAAGSVVNHSVPSNSIVAGVPAKVIRERSMPRTS
jgi:acetyltransferase-like isoleucine patch superfamily enzyme